MYPALISKDTGLDRYSHNIQYANPCHDGCLCSGVCWILATRRQSLWPWSCPWVWGEEKEVLDLTDDLFTAIDGLYHAAQEARVR